MKKKYIVLLIIVLIICGSVKFLIDLNNEKKETEVVVSAINDNYKELENNVNEYNKYRESIGDRLSTYYQESFSSNYEDIANEFKEYDKVIVNIKNNVEKINDNCGNRIFADSNINNICNGYKSLYEEMINVYLNDVNNFNRFVNTYNEENENKLSLFKSSTIDDYIDYDKDGEYKGMENNEEN